MAVDLAGIAVLLALVENPELGEDVEALELRVAELVTMGEEGMRQYARTLPAYRGH